MIQRLALICLFAGLLASPVLAEDLTIALGNNSWDDLAGLEASPAGRDAYVAVSLGDGPLSAGNFTDLLLVDGRAVCVYDLRFTKSDGRVAERPGVDLCAQSYYHFADE